MNFFNIGLPELILVLIFMLIFLGPERMKSGARSLARLISKVVRSDAWREFFGLYKEIKQYPSQLMKEVQLDEINKELRELQTKTRHEINDINQELQTREKEVRAASTEVIGSKNKPDDSENTQDHNTSGEDES